MAQYVLTIIQLLGAIAATASAYGAYRSRDNERAAALAEIKADVRMTVKRLDDLESAFRAVSAEIWDKKRGIA